MLSATRSLPKAHNVGKTITRAASFALWLIVLVMSMPGTAFGQAKVYPDKPVGFVNDFARLIEPAQAAQLERKLTAYRDSTSNVIAVATLQSLDGNSIEEVATSMFTDWRMWEGDRRNGVLVLIVPSERKLRIEVGYGLEGAIPDIMAGRVISGILQPAFREGRYYAGIDRATSALMEMAAGEYEAVPRSSTSQDRKGNSGGAVLLFIVAIIVYVVISNRGPRRHDDDDDDDLDDYYENRRRRRAIRHISYGTGWGIGGFGGGFGRGGFGGGGFGGGGFGGFGGGGGFGSGGGGASGGW